MGFNIMADDYQIVFNEEKILVRNIYCAGRNYVDHVNELNNELPDCLFITKNIFAKPKGVKLKNFLS